MPESNDSWNSRLRKYVEECRAINPLPQRSDLSPAEEWQCRIVGGTILSWLREHGPNLLQQRSVLSAVLDVDAEPLIVITSNIPGLAAAQEIIGPEHDRVVYLLEEEFQGCAAQQDDPDFKQHVHYWSYFRTKLDRSLAKEAKSKYPLPSGSKYWQHCEGTLWAENAGQSCDHLWCWNGEEPNLLEEAMSTRVY